MIPWRNHTCPQAVPPCMARPVCGLNIPLISGVGGAISHFSEAPESPGQWGRKSGWELKREHKAVFVKLGHIVSELAGTSPVLSTGRQALYTGPRAGGRVLVFTVPTDAKSYYPRPFLVHDVTVLGCVIIDLEETSQIAQLSTLTLHLKTQAQACGWLAQAGAC